MRRGSANQEALVTKSLLFADTSGWSQWARMGGRDWARMGQISQNWPEYSRMALISGQKSRFWDYFEHLGRLAPDITRMDLRGFILSIWAEVGTICSHFGVMPREVGRRSLSKTPLIYIPLSRNARWLCQPGAAGNGQGACLSKSVRDFLARGPV